MAQLSNKSYAAIAIDTRVPANEEIPLWADDGLVVVVVVLEEKSEDAPPLSLPAFIY